jgi:hypothetical protein
MALRRTLVLAAGLVAVAAPALSSCGFDYATDQPNVIADGGYNLDSNMRVLGSRIVASADGQGHFIATITLNPTTGGVTDPKKLAQQHALTGLETASTATPGVTPTIQPVTGINQTVNPEGIVNLASPEVGGIPVTGSFKAGDVVPVTLTFADGEKVTVQTPVVPHCGDYANVGSPAPSPTAATGTALPGPYDCFYPPASTPSE